MEHVQEWLARLAGDVGQRIAKARVARGMTAQAVADRCGELGLPMDRATISKLERGLRVSLHVGELLVLAEALKTSPLMLVIPVAIQPTAEILPGLDVPTWEAARWWRGEGTHIEDDGEGPVLFTDATRKSSVDWVLEHQGMVMTWDIASRSASTEATVVSAVPATEKEAWLAAFHTHREQAARAEKQLAELRKAMRDQGLIAPDLPAGLAHIEVSDATQP